MPATGAMHTPSLLPLMRYRDVAAAVDWLVHAFGFEKQVAVSDADGVVYYAQLTYGSSMIMLGGVRDTDLDRLMCQPDEIGGVETQSCYLIVDDADAHCARAVEAGADVVLEIKSDAYGRRGYSCRDPQGHIWNFGTYNPWKGFGPSEPPAEAAIPAPRVPLRQRPAFQALAAALCLGGVVLWWGSGPSPDGRAADIAQREAAVAAMRRELASARTSAKTADLAAESLRREMASERAQRTAAEAAMELARRGLAQEQAARAAAEQAAEAVRAELARERAARQTRAKVERAPEARYSTAGGPPVEREGAAGAGKAGAVGGDTEAGRTAKLPAPIETSATTRPAGEPAMASKTEAPVTAAAPKGRETATSARPAPRAARGQGRSAARAPQPAPKATYVTDLAEVPWPYSVWYGK